MTPNVNVYGQPNTWLHVLPNSSYNTDNKNLIPAWQTIAGGISAGKVNYARPLDNSICYAAIAEDATAAGAYFAAGNDLENPVENLPFKEDFFIAAGDYASGLFNSIPYYDLTDNFPQKYTYDTTSSPVSNNPNMGLKSLCSLSLKDIVLCIYVVGYNNDFTDYKISTYNGYKQQYSASHPNITRIFGIPYARGENTNNRTALTNGEQFNFNGFCRMGENNIPNTSNKYIDYFANICRDNYTDYQMTFHIWGIPESTGSITFYSSSSSYIYRAYGKGGKFEAHNGNLYYYRSWGAAYQQHSGDDWIRRAAASFGCFFTDRTSYAQTAAYASANMYLGTIDENGLCHGDYTTGADNTAQPQYNWLSTNESTYDPNKDYDETKYNDRTGFNSLTGVASCNRRYVTNETKIIQCAQAIATGISLKPADIDIQNYAVGAFLTNNPLDAIISIKKFPVKEIPHSNTSENIKFGAYENSSVTGYPLTRDFGQFDFVFSAANRNNIYPVFGNTFLDYEPYTRAELIIPFCGTVQIPLADYMNHDIKVRLIIDYITGACTAFVMRDNVALQSISGQAAIDIAISGVQQATLDSQVVNANLQYKAAQLSSTTVVAATAASSLATVGSMASGNAPAALTTGAATAAGISRVMQAEITEEQAEYNAKHVQVPFKQLSASTGLISHVYENCCRLVIYRPKLSPDYDADVYAKTVGFACLKNGKVSDFSGLTVGAINLNGVPCTAEEKTMIINDFARGVIL